VGTRVGLAKLKHLYLPYLPRPLIDLQKKFLLHPLAIACLLPCLVHSSVDFNSYKRISIEVHNLETVDEQSWAASTDSWSNCLLPIDAIKLIWIEISPSDILRLRLINKFSSVFLRERMIRMILNLSLDLNDQQGEMVQENHLQIIKEIFLCI
jgi:hypothetical protein